MALRSPRRCASTKFASLCSGSKGGPPHETLAAPATADSSPSPSLPPSPCTPRPAAVSALQGRSSTTLASEEDMLHGVVHREAQSGSCFLELRIPLAEHRSNRARHIHRSYQKARAKAARRAELGGVTCPAAARAQPSAAALTARPRRCSRARHGSRALRRWARAAPPKRRSRPRRAPRNRRMDCPAEPEPKSG